MASVYIQENADEFSPFLGLDKDDPEFKIYCDRVASEISAEWGGELELKALSCALGRTILVYSKDSPILRMNDNSSSSSNSVPLRVTYHKHYFSLGEHYNSVQRLSMAKEGAVAATHVSYMKLTKSNVS